MRLDYAFVINNASPVPLSREHNIKFHTDGRKVEINHYDSGKSF
jgi:hypothetical protein